MLLIVSSAPSIAAIPSVPPAAVEISIAETAVVSVVTAEVALLVVKPEAALLAAPPPTVAPTWMPWLLVDDNDNEPLWAATAAIPNLFKSAVVPETVILAPVESTNLIPAPSADATTFEPAAVSAVFRETMDFCCSQYYHPCRLCQILE